MKWLDASERKPHHWQTPGRKKHPAGLLHRVFLVCENKIALQRAR
jgi:hypothetical protein